MNAKSVKAFQDTFAKNQLYTKPSDCWVYGYDNSRKHALPAIVVFAHNQQDIINTVLLCYEHQIPLTARGRASGTTGAAIPQSGAVVLSLERMQKIIDFNPTNRLLIAEPGVLNADVQLHAKAHGLFWAVEPTSSPYCCIGGNLACNAAGPRSLKYGSARDNTLGLIFISGQGEVIRCGAYTTKSAVGYDLTRLLIGSEGTLGIISQATLKLTPLTARQTLRACFSTTLGAIEAITQIMSQSLTPCSCELMDENAVNMIRHQAHLPLKAKAILLIEVDDLEASLNAQVTLIKQALQHPTLVELITAQNNLHAESLWSVRKCLSQALRSLSAHKINEDVVVPISQLATLLDYTQSLAKQFDIKIVNFGHAGNGNIHVNLLVDPLDPIQGPKAQACLALLFDKVVSLQGSVSGEHGIGIEKRQYVAKELSPATLQLMRNIKAQFDPQGILNPGKLLPS